MSRQDEREMKCIINTTDDIPSPPKNEEGWMIVSKRYVLSEPFMREFADKPDLYCISNYQRLSEPFIKAFANKVKCFQTLQNRIDLPFIVQVSNKQ